MTRADQLRELEHYGFKAERLSDWSEERIATVLAARRRDNRLALARGNATATAIDGKRGQPSKLERLVAAAYLEEALACGADTVINAVLYVGHCFSDDEAKEFCRELITRFRAAQHEVGAPTTGWFDEGATADDREL